MIGNDILLDCNKSIDYVCCCMYVSNINNEEEKRNFFAKYLLDNNVNKNDIKNIMVNINKNNLPMQDEVDYFYNNLKNKNTLEENYCEKENKNFDYIKKGDCLHLLKEMDDNTVDVCFTSPPYNDSGNGSDFNRKGGSHTKYLTPESESRKNKDWFEWQCEVIDEMLRVSKKLVVYNVQGLKSNRKNVYKLIGHYADCIHDIVIWYKKSATPTSTKHKLSNRYEYLLLLKPKGVKGVDVTSEFKWNVFDVDGNRNNPYSNIHKAVMAKSLSDEVIKEFTIEGDIVLDPFFGMGTTGVSCVEQGRHYIGFELCEEYCNAAQERIENAIKELSNEGDICSKYVTKIA